MIHYIVIIIREDHVYDQEILIIYKNTIIHTLIINVEPMDIIIFVMSGVYTLFPTLASFLCLGYLPSSLLWPLLIMVT